MQNRKNMLCIIITVLMLYSVFALRQAREELAKTQRLTAEFTEKLQTLREQGDELRELIGSEMSEESIEQNARERLGLVMPGEIIYYFINGTD